MSVIRMQCHGDQNQLSPLKRLLSAESVKQVCQTVGSCLHTEHSSGTGFWVLLSCCILSLSIGNTGNKICPFQKTKAGRKMWRQHSSVTWWVLPFWGYSTAVKIQSNLNTSMCPRAGRASLAGGKRGFGLTLCGRGWLFLSASVAHL